jgi:hypothetical protein
VSEITIKLSKREQEAVLKATLSSGHGVIRSQALQHAEFKLWDAILKAQRADRAIEAAS